MTSLPAYRANLLARNAERAGCTVAELLARGEREIAVNRRCSEIRCERRTAWATIAARAAAQGRWWAVMTMSGSEPRNPSPHRGGKRTMTR